MSSSEQAPTQQTWEALWVQSDPQLAHRRLTLERQSARWNFFRDQLQQHFGDRRLRCVELGSGEGDFSILMAELGHEVTLVDFSPGALRRAQSRLESMNLRARYVQADLFEFAQANAGLFEVSVSLGLAEHFSGKKRQQIISAHREVLAADGVTFISVPHAWCLPYRLRKLYLQLRGWWRYGYTDPFSGHELKRIAGQVGFVGANTYNTGFLASIDACLLMPMTGKRRGWKDGPRWANQLGGWDVNLVARAA